MDGKQKFWLSQVSDPTFHFIELSILIVSIWIIFTEGQFNLHMLDDLFESYAYSYWK